MKRFAMIAALCVPVAGLATTFDTAPAERIETFQIKVSPDELADCEQTLRELRQKPVVTDRGWTLPTFMVDDDLPRTVCVVEA